MQDWKGMQESNPNELAEDHHNGETSFECLPKTIWNEKEAFRGTLFSKRAL